MENGQIITSYGDSASNMYHTLNIPAMYDVGKDHSSNGYDDNHGDNIGMDGNTLLQYPFDGPDVCGIRTESHTETPSTEVNQQDEDDGLTISKNVTKVLEECVRAMVDQMPPSTVQKNKGKVKRPMNSFMVFSQTARKAMAKVYPNLSYRKLSKALGRNWAVMGIEEKKPFIREAERLRQKHKEENPNYKFKSSKNRHSFSPTYYDSTHTPQNPLQNPYAYNFPPPQRLNSFEDSVAFEGQIPYISHDEYMPFINQLGPKDTLYEENIPLPFINDILNQENDNLMGFNNVEKYTTHQPDFPNFQNGTGIEAWNRNLTYGGFYEDQEISIPQTDQYQQNYYTPACNSIMPGYTSISS